MVTFLWAPPVWGQTGHAQKHGAPWFRSGTTCTSTRFFAKYRHFAIAFAGSAERGTLLLWSGGWRIQLAALREELRPSKVEEESTVAEVLTKAMLHTCTHLLHTYELWFRSGTTCTSTRFFAKYTHFPFAFAGSAERGTLLLWNGGWSIHLSHTYLRLKKNALLLGYSRRRFGTRAYTSLAILHTHDTHHPHPVSRYANHPTTFPFSLNFMDFFIFLNSTMKHLKAKVGDEIECPNPRTKTGNSNLIKR